MTQELPKGWFNEANIVTYKKLFNEAGKNAEIAEVGTWQGRSICSVAEEILTNNQHVVCVDTFEGTLTPEEASFFEEAKTANIQEICQNNIERFGLKNNVFLQRKSSLDAAELDCDEYYDLIFIDADHSYEAVKADITAWLPKVKKGGVIAGHDYPRSAVKKAVHEVLGEVEHDESTIWFKRV